MITKEIAALLDGMVYGEEIPAQVIQDAIDNRVVILVGASGNLMKFRGAIEDKISCNGGGFAYLDENGLIKNKCANESCPYCTEKRLQAKCIAAVWGWSGRSWVYTTEIPHETFEVVEEGQKSCRGIVFLMEDV